MALQPLSPVPDDPDEPIDPFDLDKLRINGIPDIPVERVLNAVPVRRPNKQEFFRVNPDPAYCADVGIYEREDGQDRQPYLVTPGMCWHEVLATHVRAVRLFVCVNRFNTVFLWPAKLPREDTEVGRRWADTALDAAEESQKLWCRMEGDRNLGGYRLYKAKQDFGEPQWPRQTFKELLKIAFRDRLIDRPDHPVIRELLGEL